MSVPVIKTYKGGQQIKTLFINGKEVDYLILKGQMVFMKSAEQLQFLLDDALKTQTVLTDDAVARWLDVSFLSSGITGNATTGWVTEDGQGKITVESSSDLQTWYVARFADRAGSPIDNGDGTYTYWSRCSVPNFYYSVRCDYAISSNRYGKSVTEISLFGTDISLPNFPYALPAQASLLQADLIAAGYAGSTVTVTSNPLTATAESYDFDNNHVLHITQSGAAVTSVQAWTGVNIALPGYPYALPSQASNLQADLRSAGYSGAVVVLWGDEWTVSIPDITTADVQRWISATISPADPFPYWDSFGNFQGYNPDVNINGAFSNVRAPDGTPLVENLNGNFARLRISLNP